MCGIAGMISLRDNGEIPKGVLEEMTGRLYHRGPDDQGFFSNRSVGLGHRRLSIIDLQMGHQPMSNKDGSIWITYNGEIYNHVDIRQELVDAGHVFKTHCDTEVVVHAYEEWGVECLSRFNGFFAFCIWDDHKKRAFIARDRMGIKPLYWATFDQKLIFSSEISSILKYPGFPREASLDAISSYLTFRQAVGHLNFVKNIHKLTPGCFLLCEKGEIAEHSYWQLPINDNTEDKGEVYYIDGVCQRLESAIKMRMMSDVPLGAYLSGGLDSSLLVAIMSKFSRDPIKTFAIGYEEEEYNEGPYAEMVSRHCGTQHRQILLSRKAHLDLWPKLVRLRGMPLSIPHEVALYQMSVELKKYVTVVLSGEGADELFGGYGRVQRSPMDWKKIMFARKFFPSSVIKKLHARFPDHKILRLLSMEKHREHFFDVYHWMPFAEKHDLFTDDALAQVRNDEVTAKIFEELFTKTAPLSPYDRVLHVFEKIHLSCLLDRLDMMSMAASVEARVPFVDHELIEFVTRIPFKYKMRWRSFMHKALALVYSSFKASEWLDINKAILRKIGSRYLPSAIHRRKKLGFPTPLDAWFQQGLRAQAKEVLLDPRALKRGIFRPDRLEKLLDHPQDLEYDFWGKKIWMLMNVEMWFREVMDQ